ARQTTSPSSERTCCLVFKDREPLGSCWTVSGLKKGLSRRGLPAPVGQPDLLGSPLVLPVLSQNGPSGQQLTIALGTGPSWPFRSLFRRLPGNPRATAAGSSSTAATKY